MIRMTVMKKSNKDDAVSPVIGVMLMLVVTIVIAAVVAAFASGLTTSEEIGPSTVLSVSMSAAAVPQTNEDYYVFIKHHGGDPLKLSELRIDTVYTVPEKYNGLSISSGNVGKIIDHTIDGSLDIIESNYLDTTLPGYPFVHQTTTVSHGLTRTMLGSSSANSIYNMKDWTLISGDEIIIAKQDFLGFDPNKKLDYGFNEGSVVHVTITHTPSNKVIFDKDVIATW